MDYFTTQHICGLFKISHQTVKTWSKEFAAYLSPTATPEEGKKRLFTVDDVRVFDLVADYRNRGYTYDDAQMALRSGQRGNVPATAGSIEPTAPPAAIVALKEEITNLRQHLVEAYTERDEARGQNKLLERQLAEKERQIIELHKQITRMESQQDD